MSEWRSSVYIVDIYIYLYRFDRTFLGMVCRKSIQFCKTIIHRKRTKEKRKNKKEGKEYYSLLFSLSSLLYLFTQENTSLHFTSPPQETFLKIPTNNPPTHQSRNVHTHTPLHPTSHLAPLLLPPPIPPPLHPLLPLLHHTNHNPHHLSHHHPKTETTKETHLGRNSPLISLDIFTFADDFGMYELEQQQEQQESCKGKKEIFPRGGVYHGKCIYENFLLGVVFEDDFLF